MVTKSLLLDSPPEISLSNISVYDLPLSHPNTDIITIDNTKGSSSTVVPFLGKASQLGNPPIPRENDKNQSAETYDLFQRANPKKIKNSEGAQEEGKTTVAKKKTKRQT